MAKNFLFMFEFVVDDVLVFKHNKCAPDEYPTCLEVTFRNSVFVSICDRENFQCVDPCKPKCGKSCLFSLENPITGNDQLHVHIYKKKTDQCKFLLGFASMPIKSVFDKVMENFNIQNPNWEIKLKRHVNALPSAIEQRQDNEIIDNDCDSNDEERHEELCPSSELIKQFFTLFNTKGCRTGNAVLLIRLIAFGPAIVSTFPFSRLCNNDCGRNQSNCNSKHSKSDANENCNSILDCVDDCLNNIHSKHTKPDNGCTPLKDPCRRENKIKVCQRYFACNADKTYPLGTVEDDCARATNCKEQKQNISCCRQPEPSNSCSCEDCIDECEAVENPCLRYKESLSDPFKFEPCSAETCGDCVDPCSPCGQIIQPCFQTQRQTDPGATAYDEFEACLNGSGLVIRVLKDTHKVENICDGTDEFNEHNASECNKHNEKESLRISDCSFGKILQRRNFARNYIKRHTGGYINNQKNLPQIRANIKYSGNDNFNTESYNVPFSKIKTYCDDQRNKVNRYRSHHSRNLETIESDIVCQPKHPNDEKNCCVQVDHQDIRKTMKGLNVDTRKKGIEVCYKTCEETDSDVFLVKLGNKKKSEYKRNNIEIELKTPKMPVTLSKQRVTTETQINEKDLDAALASVCKVKKGKGKKKRK